jgi:phage-related protein
MIYETSRAVPYARQAIRWTKLSTACRPTMPSPWQRLGKGVTKLRIWDEAGTFRVVCIPKFADAIYVLHYFQKKTPKTSKKDIDLSRKRFKELLKDLAS